MRPHRPGKYQPQASTIDENRTSLDSQLGGRTQEDLERCALTAAVRSLRASRTSPHPLIVDDLPRFTAASGYRSTYLRMSAFNTSYRRAHASAMDWNETLSKFVIVTAKD